MTLLGDISGLRNSIEFAQIFSQAWIAHGIRLINVSSHNPSHGTQDPNSAAGYGIAHC